MRRTVVTLIVCLLAGSALGFLPGPGEYETKWHLPGLDEPEVDAESTHGYDVRFYRLDIDIPMTSGAMEARAGIWLRSEEPGLDSVVFDFRSLECDSVKLNGTAVSFYESYTYLTVYPDGPIPQGDSVYLDIYYHRLAGTSNRGFYWYEGTGGNRLHNVCYSITQPNNSRYWFPCWDHPWDKAEQGCQVNVTVPDSFAACANGLLDSTSQNTDGTRTFWWTHRYPISSYLINFGASIFTRWSDWFHYSPTDSMEVPYYIWPEDSAASANAFQNVVDMIEFYSDSTRFGMYPFVEEKYGQVAVYPFGAGGMEHQTMTTIHRNWVTQGSEWGIAHELAHMWFGDFLTCFIWAEIWLNEGSATYLDPLWHYHFYGRSTFLSRMESYRQDFFTADRQDRHPIYDPGLSRLFNWGHTYCKAAWVNHMTRYVEGDTVFDDPGIWWEAERVYLDSFAYGLATTEDRKRIHEQMTGLELDWFYDEWVYQAGFPDYSVNWYGRETVDGWEIVIDLSQDNGAQAPDCFHMPVEILVSMTSGDTLLHYDVTDNPQHDVFVLSAEPTGIEFNPDAWILEQHNITSGIENAIDPEVGVARPTLHPVAPNPAAGPARIRFSLPNSREVTVSVYDAGGRLVRTLVTGRHAGGHHSVIWDCTDAAGRELAAGVYLLRLEAEGSSDSRKLVLR